MGAASETIIQAMVNEIVRLVNPRQIILFGSHARGTASADSDVDLLIVQDRAFWPEQSRFRQTGYLWRMLAHFRIPKDILLYTPDEMAEWSDSPNHVIARALREGKVLYEHS